MVILKAIIEKKLTKKHKEANYNNKTNENRITYQMQINILNTYFVCFKTFLFRNRDLPNSQ